MEREAGGGIEVDRHTSSRLKIRRIPVCLDPAREGETLADLQITISRAGHSVFVKSNSR